MELLSHDEFSAVRLRQFLPPDAEIGDYDCDRQVWRCVYHETFGTTLFCFADDPPVTLSGIYSDVGDDGLSADVADAVLRTLRLPVDSGATDEQLLAAFGPPDYEAPDAGDGTRFLRFTIGSRWPYEAGFLVRPTGGLARFWIARKDMMVEDDT